MNLFLRVWALAGDIYVNPLIISTPKHDLFMNCCMVKLCCNLIICVVQILFAGVL